MEGLLIVAIALAGVGGCPADLGYTESPVVACYHPDTSTVDGLRLEWREGDADWSAADLPCWTTSEDPARWACPGVDYGVALQRLELRVGRVYELRFRAYNADGISDPSNAITVCMPPLAEW